MRITYVDRGSNAVYKKQPGNNTDKQSNVSVEKQQTAAEAAPSVSAAVEDTVSISGNASVTSNQNKKTLADEIAEMQSRFEEMTQQLESAREQGEAAAAEWQKKLKCLKIAMRIMNGDKVPNKDHRFLAENDKDMYARAIMLRKHNDKPVKHKSLVDDEETDDKVEKTEAELRADSGADVDSVVDSVNTAAAETAPEVPEFW